MRTVAILLVHDIHEMMTAGIHAEELDIKHVGQTGKRVTRSTNANAQRRFAADSPVQHECSANVQVIIINQKFMASDLPTGCKQLQLL